MDRIAYLCENTPNLQALTLDVHGAAEQRLSVTTEFPSITSLTLVYAAHAPRVLETLLRGLPNLVRLKAETFEEGMDGHSWEQVITRCLPKLNTLQLKMQLELPNEPDRQRFFLSFATPFWREERRWFVRCHFSPDDNSRVICLYTLPYAFKYVDLFFPAIIQSTSADDNSSSYAFDQLQHLGYRSAMTDSTDTPNFRFPNLTSLSVRLPIQTHLLSLVEQFTTLRQLAVVRPMNMTNDDAHPQLQSILDRTPCLDSLKFESSDDVEESSSPLKLVTLSSPHNIRRIDLLGDNHYFNYQECEELIASRLLSKCEILAIRVKNLSAILLMVNALPHLRSLIFRSDDSTRANFRDEVVTVFVNRLRKSLPAKYSIVNDARYANHVRIWS